MAVAPLPDAAPATGSRTVRTVPDGGKTRRVYLLLKETIASGGLSAGQSLPGELKLADEYRVSRATIRKALDALAEDGLIEKRVGSGSIVTASAVGAHENIQADITNLMPQIALMGARTEARLLAFGYLPATAGIARALALEPGAPVQRAVRVRFLNGQPFSHLVTHVPEDIARGYSEADLATKPLYTLLEMGGVRVTSASQSVSAALASPDIASALDVPSGSALLCLERIVCDENGRAVEHLAASYRPDRFKLSMSLERVGESDNRHWEPLLAMDERGAPNGHSG